MYYNSIWENSIWKSRLPTLWLFCVNDRLYLLYCIEVVIWRIMAKYHLKGFEKSFISKYIGVRIDYPTVINNPLENESFQNRLLKFGHGATSRAKKSFMSKQQYFFIIITGILTSELFKNRPYSHSKWIQYLWSASVQQLFQVAKL